MQQWSGLIRACEMKTGLSGNHFDWTEKLKQWDERHTNAFYHGTLGIETILYGLNIESAAFNEAFIYYCMQF